MASFVRIHAFIATYDCLYDQSQRLLSLLPRFVALHLLISDIHAAECISFTLLLFYKNHIVYRIVYVLLSLEM